MLSPSQLCSSTSPNVTARNKRNLSICTGTNCAGRAPSSVGRFVVFSVDVAARTRQNLVLTPTRVAGHRWQALVACAAHCVGNALWVAQEQIGVDRPGGGSSVQTLPGAVVDFFIGSRVELLLAAVR